MPLKKILLADSSSAFLEECQRHEKAKNFQIVGVRKGKECQTRLHSLTPDLLITEWMLPEVHAIQLLKEAKRQGCGVIITSYHPIFQDYNTAMRLGANAVLQKPLSADALFTLIEHFFSGQLTVDPPSFPQAQCCSCMPPPCPAKVPTSYLRFWGTRGSNPVAGPEYIRFGGNTPCLEIRHGEDLVIIDAGSGIRGLGEQLKYEEEKPLTLMFSHTHWDHLLGFPFFAPIHQAKRKIKIFAPIGFEKGTKELFKEMLSYAYFPVPLQDVRSEILFYDLQDSENYDVGSIHIRCHYAFHPGPTLCFLLEVAGKKIGYVTDNEFLIDCHLPPSQVPPDKLTAYRSQIAFFQDVDLLIHEAQYLPSEYKQRVGWGHSSLSNASILVQQSHAKRWVVTHHDPRHTDEQLLAKLRIHEETLQQLGCSCPVEMAYDGMMIPL